VDSRSEGTEDSYEVGSELSTASQGYSVGLVPDEGLHLGLSEYAQSAGCSSGGEGSQPVWYCAPSMVRARQEPNRVGKWPHCESLLPQAFPIATSFKAIGRGVKARRAGVVLVFFARGVSEGHAVNGLFQVSLYTVTLTIHVLSGALKHFWLVRVQAGGGGS
jgi:hypothetical protein